MYTVVDSTTRKVTKNYAVIDGVTRNVSKMYAVVDGITRLIWSGENEDFPKEYLWNGIISNYGSYNYYIKNIDNSETWSDIATINNNSFVNYYNTRSMNNLYFWSNYYLQKFDSSTYKYSLLCKFDETLIKTLESYSSASDVTIKYAEIVMSGNGDRFLVPVISKIDKYHYLGLVLCSNNKDGTFSVIRNIGNVYNTSATSGNYYIDDYYSVNGTYSFDIQLRASYDLSLIALHTRDYYSEMTANVYSLLLYKYNVNSCTSLVNTKISPSRTSVSPSVDISLDKKYFFCFNKRDSNLKVYYINNSSTLLSSVSNCNHYIYVPELSIIVCIKNENAYYSTMSFYQLTNTSMILLGTFSTQGYYISMGNDIAYNICYLHDISYIKNKVLCEVFNQNYGQGHIEITTSWKNNIIVSLATSIFSSYGYTQSSSGNIAKYV